MRRRNQNPELLLLLPPKSDFQQQRQIMRHTKKQEKVTHTWGKRRAREPACERVQMAHLTGEDFKEATIKTFKELEETMLKDVKKATMTMSHQRIPINRNNFFSKN